MNDLRYNHACFICLKKTQQKMPCHSMLLRYFSHALKVVSDTHSLAYNGMKCTKYKNKDGNPLNGYFRKQWRSRWPWPTFYQLVRKKGVTVYYFISEIIFWFGKHQVLLINKTYARNKCWQNVCQEYVFLTKRMPGIDYVDKMYAKNRLCLSADPEGGIGVPDPPPLENLKLYGFL